MLIKTEMFKKRQNVTIRKSQESKTPIIDQEATEETTRTVLETTEETTPTVLETTEETTPTVLETPNTQDSKNDKILPVTSSEKLTSSEKNACDNIILVETRVNCIKEYLWITPKPASFFEEYFESLPKGPKS